MAVRIFCMAYLVDLSDKILSLANTLKSQKAERIKNLIEHGPRVFYELGKLVIVLLRNGEEKLVAADKNEFGDR